MHECVRYHKVCGSIKDVNLHDYILSNSLADADPGVITVGYITAVQALDVDGQIAALEPSVRPHASRLASAIRKAQRSGSAHVSDDSQVVNGGPAHEAHDSQKADGGPAHTTNDSHGSYGGPAVPEWARQNAALIGWCRDHQSDHYWIPGAGRRKLAEVTAAEWESRARWLTQQAEGVTKSAREVRAFAALITAAGAETLAGVLDQVHE